MADSQPAPVFSGSDNVTRSVWVVVDPRDAVTGSRVPVPLQVRLKDVVAQPISSPAGVYCFTDLKLAAGNYVVQVQPLPSDRGRYFDAEKQFLLEPIPIPGQVLKRNPVLVELLPRTGYPFDSQTTLVRGRLVKASNALPIEKAQVFLIVDSVDKGLRGQTDERGEFVAFFPRTPPEDTASAGLKDFKFKLRFEIPGKSHTTVEQTVKEGTAKSINETFPGT